MENGKRLLHYLIAMNSNYILFCKIVIFVESNLQTKKDKLNLSLLELVFNNTF